MWKELNDEQTRLARRFTASTKTERKVHTTKLVSRKVTRFLSRLFHGHSKKKPRFEFEHLFQQQLVFLKIPSCFPHVRCIARCHLLCVRTNLANRASHISCNRFFRGVMTPSLMPVRPCLQRLLDGLL